MKKIYTQPVFNFLVSVGIMILINSTLEAQYPLIAGKISGVETEVTQNHIISFPTGTEIGDLLLVFYSEKTRWYSPFMTTPGWFRGYGASVSNNSGDQSDYYDYRAECHFRIVDGTEGSSVTMTSQYSEVGSYITYRIKKGTFKGYMSGNTYVDPPIFAEENTGASYDPDPNQLTIPAGNKTLLIAACHNNGMITGVTAPESFSDLTLECNYLSCGGIAIATRNFDGTSFDPEPFNVSTLFGFPQWISCAVAIKGTPCITPNIYNITGGSAYCEGSPGPQIILSDSEVGVTYQLYRDGSTVGLPVPGTGSSINFGNQTVPGTYTVTANTEWCNTSVNMSGQATVEVKPLPTDKIVTASELSVCSGSGTNITVASSEIGTTYSLRNNNGNGYIGSSAVGNGGTINLSTGNLTMTKTFNVLAYNGCALQLTNTPTVTVNALPVAPTAGNISTIYDGEVHTATAIAPPGSTVVWYDAAINGSTTEAPSGTNADTYTAWAESINATGCKSTLRTQVTVTIQKANAAIVVTPYNVPFDGNAHTAAFTAVGVESPIPVDLTGLMDVSLTTHTNAGTYNADAWSFDGNGNYNLASGTVDDAIAKADANVSVTGGTWTYDAAEHGASGTATGIGGVVLTGLDLGSSFINVPGGTANWAFTDVTGNYNNKSGSVAITIAPKAASVSPIPNSKYCGQIDPAFTGTLSGFLTGDGVTAIYSRNTGESVGSNYLISAVLSPATVLSNYTITYNTANFAIIALKSIDASESSTPVPLGSTPVLKATVTPNVSGVSVTFNVENGNGSPSSFYATTDGYGQASVPGSGLTAVDVYKIIAVAGSGCAESIAYLAVYDPDGGFVTGGGWIMSPAGAYIANPALTGKANFGFVAKYKKGSNVPDGNTEFQFHEGNLNFSSSSYDLGSLVIAGYKAIYKGIGTINGIGSYKFMVSAVDGDVSGGGGYDKFRIKIWNKTDNAIVYDNNLGKDENDVPSTALGGGSIVIHKADVKTPKSMQMAEFGLKVYPNPFTDHIYFDLQLKTDSKVRLEIFDISGTKLATLYNDVVVAFDRYQLEYTPKNVSSGILFYYLIVDGQLMFDGKLIHY